jgi:hypothetical protein
MKGLHSIDGMFLCNADAGTPSAMVYLAGQSHEALPTFRLTGHGL